MGNIKMKFSIIIPMYNSSANIGSLIEQLKNQTYPEFECFLIDDGSTDSTVSECKNKITDDSRFMLICHKQNKGVSAARNKGLEKASGDYLIFVDSDDNIEENLLSEYSSLTPLNLVNTIETLYPSIIHSAKFDKLNILSSYKSSHNIKFDLLDFELKKNISEILKPKMKEITCIIVSEENLFIGYNNGQVNMYDMESGDEIKNFFTNQNESSVTVLENKGNEYLFVGYSDGTINLFDIKKGYLLLSSKDAHSTKILSIKLINIDKNFFKIISSDEEGQVIVSQFSLSME